MEAIQIGREPALQTYRRLRKISSHHANQVLRRVPKSTLLHWAKRIGLLSKQKILVAESEEELTLAFDLAVYSKRLERSTAIETYRRSCPLPQGSEEDRVLEAMCHTRFKLLGVVRPHEEGGLVARDLFLQEELWLMDEALGQSAEEDTALAARLFRPAEFWMTTGVVIPLEPLLILDLMRDFPSPANDRSMLEGRNPRFVEAFYKHAISEGATNRVTFR